MSRIAGWAPGGRSAATRGESVTGTAAKATLPCQPETAVPAASVAGSISAGLMPAGIDVETVPAAVTTMKLAPSRLSTWCTT